MKTRTLCREALLTAICFAVLPVAPSCKKGGEKGTAQGSVGASADPAALGKAIGGVYQRAMADLARLVKGHPPAAGLLPRVKALKEKVVGQLIEHGRKREAMKPAARRQVDSGVQDQIRSVSRSDFGAMSKASMFYRSKSNSLANLIGSFNVITQYAIFDLLKKQQPQEAQRLGVK